MIEQDPSRPLGGENGTSLLRLFGVDVATDFPFRTHLEPGQDPAQLRFTCNPPAPLGDTNVLGEPLYSSPWKSDSGESHLLLFEAGAGAFVLRFPETANFSVGADEVVAQPARAAEPRAVEIGFLGVVMSFWLELQGIPTLHASAVEVAGRAVAFLAMNRGGKSSIAAAMMATGHRLLTDDVLAVEVGQEAVRARPAYPAMRMWPDAVRHFTAGAGVPERVHPAVNKLLVTVGRDGYGRFCKRSLPLAAVYLPERVEPADAARVRIEPISRTEAVIELVRHSFSAPVAEAVGLRTARLDRFSDLVRRVPVRRLLYPSGLERLPGVCKELLEDLERPREKAS